MGIWTENRMEELLPIVAKLSEKYTGGDSTSVTYETAQELMEAVLYCVREYEQNQTYGYELTSEFGIAAAECYRRGYELVVRKVKKMRLFYNKLVSRFCSYGCRNYEDVMTKGLPEFFRRYDPLFAPQKTILTLDYPTLLPVEGLSGIDAIEQYLSNISLEQRFLGAFDESCVCEVLSSCDWNYREQFFNLCGIFLTCVIGCVLMRKPLQTPASAEHLARLEQWSTERSKETVQEDLCGILKKLVEEQFQGNELLYEYLCGELENLAVRIKDTGASLFSWMS